MVATKITIKVESDLARKAKALAGGSSPTVMTYMTEKTFVDIYIYSHQL